MIDDGEVRIYIARPAAVDAEKALAFVTSEEREWLAKFRFERDRHEHLVSRALVRACLALELKEAPESFRWRLGEWGKPALDPAREIFFNATNHRDLVACAVARHESLGVDVEPIARADDILEVVETVFSPAEIAALRALPLAERRERAVSLWTTKEAYIKALGVGMSAPLREMTIDLDAQPPIVVGEPGWFLEAHDRHAARIAIAVRGPEAKPRIVIEDGEALIAGS